MNKESIYIGDSAMTPEVVLTKDQITEDMFTKKQLWESVIAVNELNASLVESLTIARDMLQIRGDATIDFLDEVLKGYTKCQKK